MAYNREQWEEVSFQVFEDMGGSIRSGYYPTGTGIVDGNIAVDYAYGNFPMQPNEDRLTAGQGLLAAEDSHAIAFSEWNSYPLFASSANYMVTAFGPVAPEYTYECTSQNNLKVGDNVFISGISYLEDGFPATVTYADATKFQFTGVLGDFDKLTGLRGRVDVLTMGTGRTLEGGAALYWPAVGLCNTNGNIAENKLSTVLRELKDAGVPETFLKPATWSNGISWHDTAGDFNEDGSIFYYYVAPEDEFGVNANGKIIYGTDMDEIVIYSQNSSNSEVTTSGTWSDYVLVVFQSHTPSLNTASWL